MRRKVILGIILLVSGMMFLIFSFGNHVGDYITNNKERSLNNAKTIDDNIHEIVETSNENLDFLTSHKVFLSIQKSWLETGNSKALEEYLEDHFLSPNKHISDVLIIQDDEIILSLRGEYEYPLIKISGTENIYFCKRADERVDSEENLPENRLELKEEKLPQKGYSLAIVDETEDELQYAAIIDLEKLYNNTVNGKNQRQNGAVFISADGQFIIYNLHGILEVGSTKEMQEKLQDTECEDVLLEAHNEQKEDILRYKHTNPADNKENNDYIISLPVNITGNGIFTIGVMVEFGETISTIQTATLQTLLCGLVITVGLSILIYCMVQSFKENKRRKSELDDLYKKNEELQAQAHRQRLETIGTLTSGIAHEFNNLLTPIMGYSMITLEKIPEENEEIYDNIVEIYNASRKAKDIISRLVDLSRKRDTITYEPVCIDEVVNKVLNIINSTKPELVTAEKKLNCGESKLTCNETLIMQMLLNLILNAFQVMEETGGVMTVETKIEEEQVVISVSDTGAGIPDQYLGKVFEPFFTTKPPTKGTGLGLSIVHQVVDVHHGKIKVNNREEGGCIFTVYLPM